MSYGARQTTVRDIQQKCILFSHLSERHLLELESQDAIRTYTLEDGESLSVRGGGGMDSFYLLLGAAGGERDGTPLELLSGSEGRCHPVHLHQGERLRLVARGLTVICRANRTEIDYMLGWEALLENLEADRREDISARLDKLKNPLVFMQLPFENVVSAFEKMVPVSMDAGSEVIRQGEPGDLFYLLEEGEAEVWKSGPYDDEQQFVCKLGPGDQFGEEALVSGGTRNATIRLTRDSKLLTLAKDDFDDLIKAHLVEEVDIAVAKAMMESGRVMLDVRYEEEWEDAHIPDVKLLPLHELRDRLDELDRGARYVTYCLSGKRSAVAAMIMKQHGFDTVCMRNGLRDWPYETVAEY